jgi:hypothetical protein
VRTWGPTPGLMCRDDLEDARSHLIVTSLRRDMVQRCHERYP